MSYQYSALAVALESIAKNSSTENVQAQISKLTSDEIRKLRELMQVVEAEEQDRAVINSSVDVEAT
tara:strand:+ start:407 stop:604 length:198 start_codon:yes stop_codon:yes gene_type:complete